MKLWNKRRKETLKRNFKETLKKKHKKKILKKGGNKLVKRKETLKYQERNSKKLGRKL